MGLYTTLHIHPLKAFKPSELFLHETLNYMGATKIENAFGEFRESIFSRIRKKLSPQTTKLVSSGNVFIIECDSCEEAFSEYNIDLEQGISLWKNSKAHSVFFSLANEGWSSDVTTECENMIPTALSEKFTPWDCGITIGPWQAHDYCEGNVITKGTFSITKSADGCPTNLKEYENAFSTLPSVVDLLQYLEKQTNRKWTVTCELT